MNNKGWRRGASCRPRLTQYASEVLMRPPHATCRRFWTIVGVAIASSPNFDLQATAVEPACPSRAVFLDSLERLQGKELHNFLDYWDNRLAKCDLEDAAIDHWVTELERIRIADTYEIQRTWGKSKIHQTAGSKPAYPNRETAAEVIGYPRCRRAANELRKLPLPDHVTRMMDAIEGRHLLGPGASSHCLNSELIRLGQEAMPLIVARAPSAGP